MKKNTKRKGKLVGNTGRKRKKNVGAEMERLPNIRVNTFTPNYQEEAEAAMLRREIKGKELQNWRQEGEQAKRQTESGRNREKKASEVEHEEEEPTN